VVLGEHHLLFAALRTQVLRTQVKRGRGRNLASSLPKIAAAARHAIFWAEQLPTFDRQFRKSEQVTASPHQSFRLTITM
jgi:hypothetical protein